MTIGEFGENTKGGDSRLDLKSAKGPPCSSGGVPDAEELILPAGGEAGVLRRVGRETEHTARDRIGRGLGQAGQGREGE